MIQSPKCFGFLTATESKQLTQPNCAGCLLGNLIVDLVEQDSSFREHLTRVFDEWETALALALHKGRTQLQPDVEPDILAEQLITVIEGVMLMGRLRRNPARIHRGFDSARNLLKASLQNPSKTRNP